MCTAGMTHVDGFWPGDFSVRLRDFVNLGSQRLHAIVNMASADVLEALLVDLLDSRGTLEEQKQRLFGSYLRKWEDRVNESYMPTDMAAKEQFSAAIDLVVGGLKADWAAFSVSTDAPSSAARAGAGGVAPEVTNPTH